jgi:vancomycin resistance protein YoaR
LNRYFRLTLQILVAAALVSLLAAAVFLVLDYSKTKSAFPPHTFIGEVDVSLLTRKEAASKIKQVPIESFIKTVVFQNSRESFTFAPQELGVHVLPEETVNAAFGLTHDDNYLRGLKRRLEKEMFLLPAKFSFDEELAQDVVSELAQKINSPIKDAGIIFYEETGGYHITPDSPARMLKVAETLAAAKRKLYESKSVLPLIIDYYNEPRITEKELRAYPPVYRLSAFTTYYGSHDSPNRIHNIKLIASFVNNTLLLSDEVFSLAEKIGDFTEERGFKEAYVIMEGELVPQLGGGTCQIGTTLFNAVSIADLEILSRRNHSFYFNIYPLGRDATVYPGQVDFKFKNNAKHPILIKAVATNKKLSFRIYGTPTGKAVEFSRPEIFILGEAGVFRPSTLKEVIAFDRPFRTAVVRTVKDSQGNILKKETIRSFYKLYGDKTNVPIKRPEPR